MQNRFSCLPWVDSKPSASGRIKIVAEDFEVSEKLGFKLAHTGSHLWLLVAKKQLTTHDVVAELERRFDVVERDIGYSGLKDKHAYTRQWFSLPFAATVKCDSSVQPQIGCYQIEQAIKHTKKLKRGSHRSNYFRIVIKEVAADRADLEQSLRRIQFTGVPNYFGQQRFGVGQGNVLRALEMFKHPRKRMTRQQRSIYLSAARSMLFNQVLAERVRQKTWNQALIGDALNLNGSNSFFIHDGSDETVVTRISAFDLHPSGPLWGRQAPPVSGLVLAAETNVAAQYVDICHGLEQAGLKQQRRSLRLLPSGFCWNWLASDALELVFTLPRGAYATSIIRELVDCEHDT